MVLEANLDVWAEFCAEATRYAAHGELPSDIQNKLEPSVANGVEFSQYCNGLIDLESGELNDSLVRELRDVSSGPGDSAEYSWMKNADVHAAGDLDLIEDLALSQLDRSLSSMDEVGVRAALFELLRPQESELVRLPPELADRGLGYGSLYLPVVHPTASALVCQEVGGCYGSHHPMVLRTCMRAAEKRIGCVNPGDLIDALYQTQTPVEHRLFWSLFDQVNAMLSAYRRK